MRRKRAVKYQKSSEYNSRNHPSAFQRVYDSDKIMNPWPLKAVVTATILCWGTAINSLCFQHVSNAAPEYFFAIAVAAPLSGFFTYSILIALGHYMGYHKSQLTVELAAHALKYSVGIGACFALTNIFIDYGRSGSQAGVPDVSTVLSLILMKLVVPVSLLLESTLEGKRPTRYQISGVGVLMLGVVLTGLIYHQQQSTETSHKSAQYGLKIFFLCLASVPLSLGFYVVRVARRKVPEITGMELWAILCLPELVLSVLLSYFGQSSNLADGMACVLAGRSNSHSDANCPQAAFFFWLGLPFGFAFNLAIPVLIHLKGSTSVPLFRALALPIATLLAMTNIDSVVQTPFSWDAVLGVILCTAGLLTFYGKDVKQLMYGEASDDSEYVPIPEQPEDVEVAQE